MAAHRVGFWQRLLMHETEKSFPDNDVTASIEVKP
jgi:hypothetical protein